MVISKSFAGRLAFKSKDPDFLEVIFKGRDNLLRDGRVPLHQYPGWVDEAAPGRRGEKERDARVAPDVKGFLGHPDRRRDQELSSFGQVEWLDGPGHGRPIFGQRRQLTSSELVKDGRYVCRKVHSRHFLLLLETDWIAIVGSQIQRFPCSPAPAFVDKVDAFGLEMDCHIALVAAVGIDLSDAAILQPTHSAGMRIRHDDERVRIFFEVIQGIRPSGQQAIDLQPAALELRGNRPCTGCTAGANHAPSVLGQIVGNSIAQLVQQGSTSVITYGHSMPCLGDGRIRSRSYSGARGGPIRRY